jgi:hypothetical protein
MSVSRPHTIPADLRPRLEAVLGQRSFGLAHLCGEVLDWLEKHQEEVPEGIPFSPTIEGAQRDQ